MNIRLAVLYVALPLFIFSLNSCGKKIIRGRTGGEPAIAVDAPPPPGYAPVYLRQVQALPAAGPPAGCRLQVARIETDNPDVVRVYFHLVDSNGTHWSGGASGKARRWWCEIVEHWQGREAVVKKYWLSEATEARREAQALALVMDHSGSMGRERALTVQDAAYQFAGAKMDDDALALLKYDDQIGVEAVLTASSADLQSKLRKNGLEGFGRMTAINNGIAAGISQLLKSDEFQRKVVIVFTDGEDNSSTITADSVITLARHYGVNICAVDFGYGVNSDHLRRIADATGGTYHHMYSTDEFDDVFNDIYKRLHNYYMLEYSPENYGEHILRLKLCLPADSLKVEASFNNMPRIGEIALLNVHFDVDKASIKKESKDAVAKVEALLQAHPAMTIELRGHTDSTNSTGDPAYNLKLSQRRADAVKQMLVRQGIGGDRILSKGFGDSVPVASNRTKEGRAKNRRTEFVILTQ